MLGRAASRMLAGAADSAAARSAAASLRARLHTATTSTSTKASTSTSTGIGLFSRVALAASAAAALLLPAALASEDTAGDDKDIDYDDVILPSRSSQPAADDTTGPVVRVRERTLDAVCFDKDKHVLLELFSPSCGQCAAFAVVYKHLALALQDADNAAAAAANTSTSTSTAKPLPSGGLVLAAMDGVSDYRRGLLARADEYTFPLVLLLPKGEAKAQALAAGTAWADDAAAKGGASKGSGAQPAAPGVSWDMRWRAGAGMPESLLLWLGEKTRGEVDAEAAMPHLQARLPLVREELLAARAAAPSPGEAAAALAPCAAEWRAASDIMYLSQLGLHSDMPATAAAFHAYKACLSRTDRETQRHWRAVREHADFVLGVAQDERDRKAREDGKGKEGKSDA